MALNASSDVIRVPSSIALAGIAAALLLGMTIGYEEGYGVVQGTVVLERNGIPAAGVSVQLVPEDRSTDDSLLSEYSERTLADGSFRIQRVEEGRYVLTARSYACKSEPVLVEVSDLLPTRVELKLRFTRARLEVIEQTTVFRSDEEPSIALVGALPESVDAVTTEVFRVPLDEALKSKDWLSGMESAWLPREGGISLASAPDNATAPDWPLPGRTAVRSVRVPLKKDWEGYFETRVRLGPLPYGLYLVNTHAGSVAVRSVLIVSDLALIVVRSSKRCMVLAADARTGEPRPNTLVQVEDTEGLWRTDAAGMCSVAPLPEKLMKDEAMFVGRFGQQVAVADLYGRLGDEDTYRFGLYTDRPIYRPGDTVRFKGLLRRLDVDTFRAVSGAMVEVQMTDPSGVLLRRTKLRTNAYGSFYGSITTSPATPSGECVLTVAYQGARDALIVSLAPYRKPEIEVRLEPPRRPILLDQPLRVEVTAQYYYGAPLAQARGEFNLRGTRVRPVQRSWFDENDESAMYQDEDETHYESYMFGQFRTDDRGRATIELPRDKLLQMANGFPVDLGMTVEFAGGATRGGEASVEFRAYPSSVIVCLQDPPGSVRVGKGEPVSARVTDLDNRPMTAVDVRFQVLKEQDNGQRTGILTSSVRTDAEGVAQTVVLMKEPGAYTLVAEVRDNLGRVARTQCDLWAWRPLRSDTASAVAHDGARRPFLSLLPARSVYRPGEKAELLLRSNCIGATALLVVETPGLSHVVPVPVRARDTAVTIPVLTTPRGQLSVTACLVARGVFLTDEAVLVFDRASRTVRTVLSMPRSVYRPGETVPVEIKTMDEKGRPLPVEVSVAVVDETVYAVREDEPSSLFEAFYQPDPYGVDVVSSLSESLYDQDERFAKIGATVAVRHRFPDTAFWAPAVETGPDGRAKVWVRLPDSITRWRITARAHTRSTRIGYERATVTSRLPFHISINSPPFLTVGDQTQVVATIRNGTTSPVAASAVLECPTGSVSIGGVAEQAFTVGPSSSVSVGWPVEARLAGSCVLRARTRSKDGTLADAMSLPVLVRPRGHPSSWSTGGLLDQKVVHRMTLDADGARAPTYMTLRVTPTVLDAVGPGLDYLIGYPYGCTEQTASRLVSNVVLSQALQTLPPAVAKTLRASVRSSAIQALPALVTSSISRLFRKAILKTFDSGTLKELFEPGEKFEQDVDGGTLPAWGWFELAEQPDPWMTGYATMALGLARRSGYEIPAFLNKAPLMCRALARRADADCASFLRYAIALHPGSVPPLARFEKLSAVGLSFVILEEAARDRRTPLGNRALERLVSKAIRDRDLVHWEADPSGRCSEVGATALALHALSSRAPRHPLIPGALRYLMSRRTDDYWISTQDTNFVLMAIMQTLHHTPLLAQSVDSVTVRINGLKAVTLQVGASSHGRELVSRFQARGLRPGDNKVEIEAKGPGRPYFTLHTRAYLSDHVAASATKSRGLKVERTYTVVPRDWRPGMASSRLRHTERFRANEMVLVQLRVTAPRQMDFMMITDPYPAGFEPVVLRDDLYPYSEVFGALDIRDDHAAIFAERLPEGTHRVEYLVRARRAGRFRALGPRVESMYDPTVWAEAPVQTIQVR